MSHWTTVRPVIAAFSIGTVSQSGRRVITNPPTWIERWRGKPCSSRASASVCARAPSRVDVEPRLREELRPDLREVLVRPDELREPVDLLERQPERLAHVAQRGLAAVADDLADHPRAVPPVPLVDVLEHLLAPLVLEVDVDVGRLACAPPR